MREIAMSIQTITQELIFKFVSEHAGAFQSPVEDQRNGYLDSTWRSAGTYCLQVSNWFPPVGEGGGVSFRSWEPYIVFERVY